MDLLWLWLASVPDFAVPYALAALGLILIERSGVLCLGAEGLMLVGALAAVAAQLAWGTTPVSLAVAMLAAAAMSLPFVAMVVWLRVQQVIAGLALVFLCQGLTSLLGTVFEWTNRPVSSVEPWAFWPLSALPGAGVLFVQNPVAWATPFVAAALAWWLARTRGGLRLRAVGDNPQAADAAGVPVLRIRVLAILAGAMLIGLAGAYLSLLSTRLFVAGMSGGRGWIAIALVVFAQWAPWRALAGALLFGCAEALIPQLAAAGVPLPKYFVLMTPYVVTLAVMVWVMRGAGHRSAQPAALGEPFVREERR